MQGGLSVAVDVINICASNDQSARHVDVAHKQLLHQDCHVVGVFDVEVLGSQRQVVDDLLFPLLRSEHERRLAERVLDVQLGFVVAHQLEQVGVLVVTCQEDGRQISLDKRVGVVALGVARNQLGRDLFVLDQNGERQGTHVGERVQFGNRFLHVILLVGSLHQSVYDELCNLRVAQKRSQMQSRHSILSLQIEWELALHQHLDDLNMVPHHGQMEDVDKDLVVIIDIGAVLHKYLHDSPMPKETC